MDSYMTKRWKLNKCISNCITNQAPLVYTEALSCPFLHNSTYIENASTKNIEALDQNIYQDNYFLW